MNFIRRYAAALGAASPNMEWKSDRSRTGDQMPGAKAASRRAHIVRVLGDNPIPAALAMITAFAFASACTLNLGYVLSWDQSALFIFTPGDYVSLGVPTTMLIVIALALFLLAGALFAIVTFITSVILLGAGLRIQDLFNKMRGKNAQEKGGKGAAKKEKTKKKPDVFDAAVRREIYEASAANFEFYWYFYWVVYGFIVACVFSLFAYFLLGYFVIQNVDSLLQTALMSTLLFAIVLFVIATVLTLAWFAYWDSSYLIRRGRRKRAALRALAEETDNTSTFDEIVLAQAESYRKHFFGRTDRMANNAIIYSALFVLVCVTFAGLPAGYSLFQGQWRSMQAERDKCIEIAQSNTELGKVCLLRPIERGVLVADSRESQIFFLHADTSLTVTYDGPAQIPVRWKDINALQPIVQHWTLSPAIARAERAREKKAEKDAKSASGD